MAELRRVLIEELEEGEALPLARLSVDDDAEGRDGADLREERAQLVLRAVVRQVADEDGLKAVARERHAGAERAARERRREGRVQTRTAKLGLSQAVRHVRVSKPHLY